MEELPEKGASRVLYGSSLASGAKGLARGTTNQQVKITPRKTKFLHDERWWQFSDVFLVDLKGGVS